MDFSLIDDSMIDLFARAIIAKYLPHREWRTHKEYEIEVQELRQKIVERFNHAGEKVHPNGFNRP